MTRGSRGLSGPSVISTVKPLLSIAVVLLVVVGMYFIVRALPLNTLGEIRQEQIVWRLLPAIVILQILFWLLATVLWRQVVIFSAGFRMTMWSSYLQLAVVGVGKYVPGKVWGFIGRAGDMYRQQIPVHLSVFSSIVEQGMAIAGALIVSVAAALIALPDFRVATLLTGALLLIATIAGCIRSPEMTHWLLRRRRYGNGLAELPKVKIISVITFALGYAMLWSLTGLVFSSVFFCLFDSSVTIESIAALVLANTVGIVLGFFAFFVPGGIGVREAVAAFILSEFVPLREALLAAVCYRAMLVVIDGFNALVILGRESAVAMRGPAPESGHAE